MRPSAATAEHTPLDTLSLCLPQQHAVGGQIPGPHSLFCRFEPHSAGGGNPKALLFMLDNNLYLHPSLSEVGDHENLPDHPNHLGNGEGDREWGSGVCPHAAACCCKIWVNPKCLSAFVAGQVGKWECCLYVPGSASDSLATIGEELCPEMLVAAQTEVQHLQHPWPQVTLANVAYLRQERSGWLQERGTSCQCCAICS